MLTEKDKRNKNKQIEKFNIGDENMSNLSRKELDRQQEQEMQTCEHREIKNAVCISCGTKCINEQDEYEVMPKLKHKFKQSDKNKLCAICEYQYMFEIHKGD